MPVYTLADAQANLTAAQSALTAAMQVQDYSISGPGGSGRRVQRASVADLIKERDKWERIVSTLSRGGSISSWSVAPQ